MAYDFGKWSAELRERRPRRRITRWLLLAGIATALGFAVAQVFLAIDPDRSLGFDPWALFPLALGIGLSPFGRDTWFTSRGMAVFDEFERAALQRASAYSYRVLLSFAVLCAMWLALASSFDLPAPRAWQQWTTWGMTMLVIGAALPILFAEFLVPLPPEGEVEEDL